MALFLLEEVHFHLNEGRSPKRVVSRLCACEMCWQCSMRLSLHISALCFRVISAESLICTIPSFLSHCLLIFVPVANSLCGRCFFFVQNCRYLLKKTQPTLDILQTVKFKFSTWEVFPPANTLLMLSVSLENMNWNSWLLCFCSRCLAVHSFAIQCFSLKNRFERLKCNRLWQKKERLEGDWV